MANLYWSPCYRQIYPAPVSPGYPGTPAYPGAYPGTTPGIYPPGVPGGAGFPGIPGMPADWGQPMAQQVLRLVEPVVRYAAYEQQVEGASIRHTIREVAAIAYLMGRGLPFPQARRIVESWEIDEKFPGYWE